PCDLVPRLQLEGEGMTCPLVLAATRDDERIARHPTFGLWPVALRDDLRKALDGGLRKVVLWTDEHHGRAAVFPTDGFDPFFNVNTPDDLARAEALI
ncbi:MAG: molybdenum cofactor guanylyltransferase MobA, partial [Pseudomonadota bacterium]